MAGAESRRPPAPGEDVKPFTPGKAKEIVMSLQQPAVFCNMAGDWPALHWNTKYLSAVLDGKTIQFRLGQKTVDLVPQFETRCSYVEATLEEFLAWSCGEPSCLSGPFSCYEYSKYWAYADYKYIARIFEDKPEIFQDVRWSDFGFPGRSGKESTLWIGSEGANTPCHLDSYGCNLVLQVQGRKRWHLFPPGDTSFLYPTRIPYEESSIFSKVNVTNPDLKCFPEFRNTTAHVVTLSPGQGCRQLWDLLGSLRSPPPSPSHHTAVLRRFRVLRVYPGPALLGVKAGEERAPVDTVFLEEPSKVPDLKPQFSRNHMQVYLNQALIFLAHVNQYVWDGSRDIISMLQKDADHEARVEEAITRMLVCAIKSAENPGDGDLWLNPTEVEATSHEINLQYLNEAVSAYFRSQKASPSERARPGSTAAEPRTSTLCKRKRREADCQPEGCRLLTHESGFSAFKAEKSQEIPFGPHLIQVLPQSQETSLMAAAAVESDSEALLHENEGGHLGKLHCTRKRLVTSNDHETPAHQMDADGSPNASQTALSTNDLLDCLVNPRVISLVAQLLLERTRV